MLQFDYCAVNIMFLKCPYLVIGDVDFRAFPGIFHQECVKILICRGYPTVMILTTNGYDSVFKLQQAADLITF